MARSMLFIFTQRQLPIVQATIHIAFAICAIILRKYPHHKEKQKILNMSPKYIDYIFWGLATLSILFAFNLISSPPNNSTNQLESSSIGSKQKKRESSTKKIPIGIKILQARYGTSSKDIDVTTIVQNMVTDNNMLKISRSLSFNKVFGDPHSFRRKKLRLIGSINGKPFVETINEIRWKDFIIDCSINNNNQQSENENTIKNNNNNYDHNNNESNIVQTTTATTTSTTGDKSNYNKCVNTIMSDFHNLANGKTTSFASIETEPFLIACLHVADLIDLCGSSFLPVKANITDNVAKIRKNIKKNIYSNTNSNDNRASHVDGDQETYPTTVIGELIQLEVENETARKDGSVTISTLWLKRALDFMIEFFSLLSTGLDTFDSSQKAFKLKLAPWQGWIVQTTCKTALRLVPSRAAFVKILMPNMKRDSLYIEEENMKEREIKALKDVLAELLNSGLKQVVEQMDDYFDKTNLDYPDKC